jgi:hypothetical protein
MQFELFIYEDALVVLVLNLSAEFGYFLRLIFNSVAGGSDELANVKLAVTDLASLGTGLPT